MKRGGANSSLLIPNFSNFLNSRTGTRPAPANNFFNYKKTMKKETWKMIINMIISVLTAIATTLGLSSCIM